MNPTLLIVMAHSGSEAACLRHLPYWKSVSTDIVFFSPLNSVVQMGGYMVWAWGSAGHHSIEANQRYLAVLVGALASRYDHFIITEYDGPVLGPLLDWPADDQLAGNVFRDTREDRGFVGTTFIHPPFFMSRKVMERIVQQLRGTGDQEQYFYDRWLGLATERMGLLLMNLLETGEGYSQNTISEAHFLDAASAVSKGAVAVHGCKTAKCFEVLESARKEYLHGKEE